MKLAIVTSLPPSKVTLNEYGFHLVKNFMNEEDVDEIIILTDANIPDDLLDTVE